MFNFEYMGNIHIHSLHSDGGSSVQEIAQSANRIGLDFICLNEHAHMTDTLHLDEEGFYGNVLVLLGLEIGERYHHYLAYDLKGMINGQDLSPQEVIDRVREQEGFGFLAHPFEKGMPFLEKSVAYTWNDLSVTGYCGICLWNFTSRWKERVKSALHGLFFLIFRTQTLNPPSQNTLSFWDERCGERRVVAIGGSDAHGSSFRWGAIHTKPLSYDYLLNTINIHILLQRDMPKDLQAAKSLVYEAMKEGRLFIAHDNLFPAKGFRFQFFADDGSDLTMGEEAPFRLGHLRVELPDHGEMRLYRNGRLTTKQHGKEASYRVTEKGVYRIEVYRRLFLFGWRPWIFSNPIYLR